MRGRRLRRAARHRRPFTPAVLIQLFHIATAFDWEAAQACGRYTTSTRGRTLADDSFIHASRADQWPGVRDRFYADVTAPLVLLVVSAAVRALPLPDDGSGR